MTEEQIIELFIRAAEVERKLPNTARRKGYLNYPNTQLTFAKVNRLLIGDPLTGKLVWKRRPLPMFRNGSAFEVWNTKHAGKEAFTHQDENGYFCGGILGKTYRAHRIIWLLHYKKWPKAVIDHINGDPSDNRIINLRDVPQAENARNTKASRLNAGGVV